jgi:hypothetical protein
MDEKSLSPGTVAAFSRFALWVANGSVGHPLLENTDYAECLRDPSCMEQVFAIFGNVLRLDAEGEPLNYRHAQRRAALYLYGYCNGWDHWPGSDPELTFDETELPSSPGVV